MKLEEKQYLGILPTETEVIQLGLQDAAFLNTNNEIQYSVKNISKGKLPRSFYGYINCFHEDCGVEEDYYEEDHRRESKFLTEVQDKVFLFSYTQRNQKYYNILEAQLLPVPENFDRNERFVAVPVFAAKEDPSTRSWERRNAVPLFREYTSFEEFTKRVASQEHVGGVAGYDMENNGEPAFVIWKEADGTLYAVSGISEYKESVNNRAMITGNKLGRYELSNHEREFIYNGWVNPTLLFLSERVFETIQAEMEITAEYQEMIETVQECAATSTPMVVIPSSDKAIGEEEQLLLNMKQYANSMDLEYKESDLVNFHTAVKCSDLVVLSGMSGTGKSALVDVYAKALGVSQANQQFLFVPVRPSWSEDADLLGHIDLVNNRYHASDTGFVNLLVEAQKEENKDKLYLVCFDEMNLARVEHYFSQFLSILEKPVGERELILYDRQYCDTLENAADYPWKITIGENVRFIGTVNVDESTYHFSDKVLDRANVITLEVMDYSMSLEEEVYEEPKAKVWTATEYSSMISANRRNQELRALLWDIHQALQRANSKLGVGPRIVKSMEQYIANLPERIGFCVEDAIDYQIVQRVLTKVRGPETQLGALLGTSVGEGLLEIFDRHASLSTFEKSRQVVENKRKELEVYGYCI